MPTIRFTPLRATPFQQSQAELINTPRDVLIQQRNAATVQITQALAEGLGAKSPLVSKVSELTQELSKLNSNQAKIYIPSAAALKVVAALKPVLSALTDQHDASSSYTEDQLKTWRNSRAAKEVRQWLDKPPTSALADAFWQQGCEFGGVKDTSFEAVRRARLGNLLKLLLQIAQQVHDEPPPAAAQ
jgi:hypothetical protein